MRSSHQPLAHLVDAAAEQWLAAEHAPENEKLIVGKEIAGAFRISDNSRLTFHGLRYLLSISHNQNQGSGRTPEFLIEVHEIALNE